MYLELFNRSLYRHSRIETLSRARLLRDVRWHFYDSLSPLATQTCICNLSYGIAPFQMTSVKWVSSSSPSHTMHCLECSVLLPLPPVALLHSSRLSYNQSPVVNRWFDHFHSLSRRSALLLQQLHLNNVLLGHLSSTSAEESTCSRSRPLLYTAILPLEILSRRVLNSNVLWVTPHGMDTWKLKCSQASISFLYGPVSIVCWHPLPALMKTIKQLIGQSKWIIVCLSLTCFMLHH